MNQSDNSVFTIYREGYFDFEEISQTLKMVPDKATVATDKAKNTCWKLLSSNKDCHLEEQLEYWIVLLLPKSNELRELKENGWIIELDCLVQSDEGSAVVNLEPKLLQELSKLHVALTIRMWA
ncbi:DUF4279 domain-containing protein [Grimontia marina]|uniref:DUF4279 domain-containing protein n=1 Tax=Grimontia marina TaxID=646534 RepID=A0A128EZR5_9GAMM|nr:DUF4279 domain-containing protein [Grimontia marina]CZF79644.1 hypothetical protein GMA8713_01061 [Grimontia marina]